MDIYSGDHGFSSWVDITGESIIYINLNSRIDLGTYLTKIVQLIQNDIDINSSTCRIMFSFSKASDKDLFTALLDTLRTDLPNIEGGSRNHFLTMNDFMSHSKKPRADYQFLK